VLAALRTFPCALTALGPRAGRTTWRDGRDADGGCGRCVFRPKGGSRMPGDARRKPCVPHPRSKVAVRHANQVAHTSLLEVSHIPLSALDTTARMQAGPQSRALHTPFPAPEAGLQNLFHSHGFKVARSAFGAFTGHACLYPFNPLRLARRDDRPCLTSTTCASRTAHPMNVFRSTTLCR